MNVNNFFNNNRQPIATFEEGLNLALSLKDRAADPDSQKLQDDICREIVALPEVTLLSIAQRTRQETDPLKKAICSYLLPRACSSSLSKPLSKRMIYQIRFNEEIVGYLMGIMHIANPEVSHDPILTETVRKCSRLIVEVDQLRRGGDYNYNYINFFQPSENMGYLDGVERLDGMELILREVAKQNQIAVEFLESEETSMRILEVMNSPQHLQVDSSSQIGVFLLSSFTLQSIFCLDVYRRGDFENLAFLSFNPTLTPEMKRVAFDQRHDTWLRKGPDLIDRLRNPRIFISNPDTGEISIEKMKPLCIAVGAAHCIEEERGLVSQLRAEGFDVVEPFE